MHRDQDFDLNQKLPPNQAALTQDLELNTLFTAMALGDQYLFDVATKAALSSLTDPEAIIYRQRVLADCLAQPAIVRRIYDIAVDALQAERKIWGIWGHSPDAILHRSVQVTELLVGSLKALRKIANDAAGSFRSEGFVRFFAMLASELDDSYFLTVEAHLRALKFPRGVLISAGLGTGNRGVNYMLRAPREQRWIERIASQSRPAYSFRIHERDEAGFRALEELRGQGINLVANALAQSADHIRSFFSMVRAELAFYVGCLNLHARLHAKVEPVCFPVPLALDGHSLSAQGLYDVCLSLLVQARVIGNAVDADQKSLVIITGANQGGKSTFLRSVGLAQLMMQCGMFVAAESLRANVSDGIYTHFKREEDSSMHSGKLDEELSRMSRIADTITPRAMLLCNESFASTNEREGSEIARQVIRALVDADIKVLFVTHLFDLAHGLALEGVDTTLLLRAERQPDGQRSFRIIEGDPLPTSFGEDTYERVFGPSMGTSAGVAG